MADLAAEVTERVLALDVVTGMFPVRPLLPAIAGPPGSSGSARVASGSEGVVVELRVALGTGERTAIAIADVVRAVRAIRGLADSAVRVAVALYE